MIDVLIAGGGPIGLAAGIEARKAGMDVVVVEPRRGPVDKACGEGLMPGAVGALERLGVNPDGHDLKGISYQSRGLRVDHSFRHGAGLGVRRTVLHAALAERAADVGVETVHQRVVAVRQNADAVTARLTDGTRVRSAWLLGCDGLHSQVRDLVELGTNTREAKERGTARRGQRRFGLNRHFALPPWSDFVEVHWTQTAELYVTPVSANEVGVAVLGPRHTNYVDALRMVPALAERLEHAESSTSVLGAGPLRQPTRARVAQRVLLVGDASGYVDAITGEGIRVGLAQARAAIGCIIAGEPARYEHEWRKATRDYRILTSGLVALGASPLRRFIVPAASSLPGVYGAIVERFSR